MAERNRVQPWRVGLVGCGTSLSLYEGIQFPNEYFQLVAVADETASRRQLAIEKWGVSHDYSTAREMFEKEKLQLAIIATPPESHLPCVLDAMEYGIHVLIQKPLARTLSEAKQIIEACRRHELGCKVSFYRRHTPAFQAARHLVENLGQPLALRVRWCSSSGLEIRKDKVWKEDINTLGGVLVDLGSHVIDIARWWMGEVREGHLAISIVRGDLDNISSFLLSHDIGSSTLGYISNLEYSSSEIYEYVGMSGGFTLERQIEGYPGSWTLRSWATGESRQTIKLFEPPEANPFLAEVIAFILALDSAQIDVDAGDLGTRTLEITTMLYWSASNTEECELEMFSLEDFFRTSKNLQAFPR